MSLDRIATPKKLPESRFVRAGRKFFAATIVLTSIAWSLDLFRSVGVVLYNEQFLAGILSFALALIFIQFPANRGTKRTCLPWYDALAALAGIVAGMYVAVFYPEMVDRMMEKPIDALIVSIIIFVLCLEGIRRSVGWALVIVLVVFVGYALLGHMGPGIIQTRAINFKKLFIYLALDTSALLGIALNISATLVIAFMFFGQLLLRSHGSDFFNDFAIALMGRYRGGSAKIAITASSLFGSISGISSSNIMATGVVTIPLMKKAGYPSHVAAAIEAVASTGSSLVPPVGVYVLLAVVVAPSLIEVGIPPLAAHMFILYFGLMSMITPPVAISAFFAANLASASPMKTAFAAMRLGWPAFIVPFLFVFSPSLLLLRREVRGGPRIVVAGHRVGSFPIPSPIRVAVFDSRREIGNHAAQMVRDDLDVGMPVEETGKNEPSHRNRGFVRPTKAPPGLMSGSSLRGVVRKTGCTRGVHPNRQGIPGHRFEQGRELSFVEWFAGYVGEYLHPTCAEFLDRAVQLLGVVISSRGGLGRERTWR